MSLVQDQDINDLVTGTLRELGRLRFNNIATRLQNYEVMGRLMKKDKVQFDSGLGIQRTLMVDHSGGAKMTGLFEKDTLNIGTVLQTIQLDWKHTSAAYAYERRELLTNRGYEKIVDILKVRRTDCMIALAELMEDQFWSAPAAGDELSVNGVPYWIVQGASGGSTGFNSAGTIAGLDDSTYTRWQNWSGDYLAVNKTAVTGLIPQLRDAYREIRFKSPVGVQDFRKGNGMQYRLYTDKATIQAIETLGEGENENLGRDIASMDGVMTFRGNPIIWVPKLDSSALDGPVYMINFGYFNPVFLKGDYLRETQPRSVEGQHNAWAVFIDTTWNVLCTDRRCQAVLSQVA